MKTIGNGHLCLLHTIRREVLTWLGVVGIKECRVPFTEEETQAETGRVGQSRSSGVAEPGLKPRSESKTLFPPPYSCCFTVLRFGDFYSFKCKCFVCFFNRTFFCLTLLTGVCSIEQMSIDVEVLKSSTSFRA